MNTSLKRDRRKKKISCREKNSAMPCGGWFERIKAIAVAARGEAKTVASVLWSLFIDRFSFGTVLF
jgi:hypothetical protein